MNGLFCNGILLLRVEDSFEEGAEAGLVVDEGAELGEARGVGGLGDPELEVAALRVLLVEVLQGAAPVLLAVELGVVGEAELDGAADDGLRLDLPVGPAMMRP